MGKISFKDIEQELYNIHGNKIKLLEIDENIGRYRMRCLFKCSVCGYKWNGLYFHTIKDENGCQKCSSKIESLKRAYPKEFIINYINNHNCEFISFLEEHKNSKTKIWIKFLCGHEGETTLERIKKSVYYVCPKCSKIKADIKRIKTEQNAINEINNTNFIFVKFPNNYKNCFSLVTYQCSLGHLTTRILSLFLQRPTCGQCEIDKMSKKFSGSGGYHWNGGTTEIRSFLRKHIQQWKIDSMKSCNYLCVIENKPFDKIHHLYGFNLILEQTLQELNIPIKVRIGDYTPEELELIKNKCQEIHNKNLGICLTKKCHDLYHKIYGYGNNTPTQFEEFKSRIQSGEIIISQ